MCSVYTFVQYIFKPYFIQVHTCVLVTSRGRPPTPIQLNPGNISQGKSGFEFNSLPNDKILDWSKLKAVADDKINATEIFKFVF